MNGMSQAEASEISVVICTRNRPDVLPLAVQSVLADAPADGSVEVVVIDQSDSDASSLALAPLRTTDQRLRYLRETSVGAAAARNAGAWAARGHLIAFMDDDCTSEPGWLAAIKATFAAHPDVGVIFGYVGCMDYDHAAGYVTVFEATDGLLTHRRMLRGSSYWGLSANMAVRRSAWERIGPFEETLGAGTARKSGEEMDYALRAVRRGVNIYHAAQARVIHYGFRTQTQARALFIGYALGSGFVYGRHVRSGSLFAAVLWLWSLLRDTWNVTGNVLRRRRPSGARSMAAGLKGFWQGVGTPLDRRSVAPGPLLPDNSEQALNLHQGRSR